MVWQQALYLVNLLCKFVPCDYNFPYPDTSLSEPQFFQNLISVGFDEKDKDNPGSLRIGGWGEKDTPPWPKELDYTENDPLIVITKTGKLRGFWMKVVGGRKIRAWEGIPYAEPPTGYFRFGEPSPKIAWSGLQQATKKGPKCLQFSQIELRRVVGSEDCLCLNVYAPQVNSNPGRKTKNGNFPVMIFIHGGGFQIGAGNDYGPSYLLQQDIILVTFNYRVGIFGFMSTGDSQSPGNYGLKDQSLAIQWVYENIEFFNGDPSRITLIGQEAGGASVHLQMLSKKATRFFQAGVSMSGSAFNPWVFCSKEAAKDLTKHLAKKINCPVHSSEAIVSCLRRTDGNLLAKAQIQLLDDLPIPMYLFRPVLEDLNQKEEPFITESPEILYRNENVARIPWISGFTEDEGLTFLLPLVFRGTIKRIRSNWNNLAADFLDYQQLKTDQQDEITKKVNWLYFKQQSPLNAPIKTFSDALSSRFTITGIHKALQAHSILAPTYAYMFSYNGKYNLATMAGIKPSEWGVGQGEDTFYLFNSTHLYQGFKKSDHELILAKIMVNLFGNFASKRFPTFTLENNEDFQIWNPITDPRNMSFLLIHKKIKMIPEPYLKQTVYWESIGLPDTTPLINSSNHYRDFHGLGSTTPDPPPQNSFYSFGSVPDVFDLRNFTNFPANRLTKSIIEKEKDDEEKEGIKGVHIPPLVEDPIEDDHLFFQIPSTTTTTTEPYLETKTTKSPNAEITTTNQPYFETTTTEVLLEVPPATTTEEPHYSEIPRTPIVTPAPTPILPPTEYPPGDSYSGLDENDYQNSPISTTPDDNEDEDSIYLPPWHPPELESGRLDGKSTTDKPKEEIPNVDEQFSKSTPEEEALPNGNVDPISSTMPSPPDPEIEEITLPFNPSEDSEEYFDSLDKSMQSTIESPTIPSTTEISSTSTTTSTPITTDSKPFNIYEEEEIPKQFNFVTTTTKNFDSGFNFKGDFIPRPTNPTGDKLIPILQFPNPNMNEISDEEPYNIMK